MSDFSTSWTLSRQRLVDTVSELNADQLNWRLHPGALSIGQMTVHVAGVEISFASQLLGIELDENGKKLKSAATDGVVNDKPFPYTDAEITPQLLLIVLSQTKVMLEPLISNPSQEILAKELVSALGPVITGQ